MFNQMKQLYDMQKKAKELQKQLESIKIEKKDSTGTLTVAVNGAQKVERLDIGAPWLAADQKEPLEHALVKLVNDAFEAAQKQSASQAAALMKDFKGLGIPGL